MPLRPSKAEAQLPLPQFLGSAPEPEGPKLGDTLGAAFAQENPVRGAISWLRQKSYEPDPEFDFEARAQESDVFLSAPDSFYRAQSKAEFDAIEGRVREELANRRILASAGIPGFLAAAGASMLSPDILLPGSQVVRAKKLASILGTAGRTALATGVVTAGQEVVLQGAQETRTGRESAYNVIGATVIGGLLGGAAGAFTRQELSDIAAGMDNQPGVSSISPLPDRSIGAAEVPPHEVYIPDIGDLAPSFGLAEASKWLSPITRTVANPYSRTSASVMAMMDSGGIFTTRAVPGGDVASAAKQYDFHLVDFAARRKELMDKNPITRIMTAPQFGRETLSALRGGQAPEPARKMAEHLRQQTFLPLLKEAQKVGLITRELDDEYVMKYAPRVPNVEKVIRRRDQFEELLTEHFTERMTQQMQNVLDKVRKQRAGLEDEVAILRMTPEEAQSFRESVEAEYKAFAEALPEGVKRTQVEIEAKTEQRNLAKEGEREKLNAELEELRATLKEQMKPFRDDEKPLKNKMALLRRGRLGMAEERAKALDAAEDILEKLHVAREKLVDQAQKVLKGLDRWDEKKINVEIERLEKKFFHLEELYVTDGAKLDELETRIADADLKFADEVKDLGTATRLAGRQDSRAERLDKLEERIEGIKSLDLDAKRQIVKDRMLEAVARLDNANTVRANRYQSYMDKAAKASDESVELEIAKRLDRRGDIGDRFFERNAPRVKYELDTEDFPLKVTDVSAAAREAAQYMTGKYIDEPMSNGFFTALNERGPELARMLDIDETRTWANGARFEEFMEDDVERVLHGYVRTMGVDIELQRKFGSVNPLHPDSDYRAKIEEDFAAAREKAKQLPAGKPREKELERIATVQRSALRDMQAVLDRIRHVRGISNDPTAIGYRAGKVALDLNTTRLMGGVLIASVPDPAYIMMRHGFGRLMGGAFDRLRGGEIGKMTRRELELAGVGIDLVTHGRFMSLNSQFDQVRYGTMPEKGLNVLANNTGIVNLYDQWTTWWKQTAGGISLSRIMDAIERPTKAGNRYLEHLGIDERLSADMLRELQESGTKVNGRLLPNTEDWGKKAFASGDMSRYERALAARRALRSALARETDDTVITPGAELPLMADAGIWGRVIFQFRSFMFSSHQKIILNGAQRLREGDLNVLTGAAFSVALGALSYYIWAHLKGGDQLARLEDGGIENVMQEAILRSGLLGAASDVHKFLGSTPGLAGYVDPGAAETSFNFNPVMDMLGPSVGLVEDMGRAAAVGGKLAVGDDPSEGDWKGMSRLVPYNNSIWWSTVMKGLDLL